MTTSAIRRALRWLPAFLLISVASPARANDKADCAAAQKAAQTDKGLGKLTKALTELATCSRPVCPKAMQKQCSDMATAVTASQPTVVFSAKDASGKPVTKVTVTVDGNVVSSELDGTPVPLDPGSHSMKFEMEGATTVEKQVMVDDDVKGQTVSVDLDAKAPPAVPVPNTEVIAHGADDTPGSMTDVLEDPMKRYYFIGVRYRGDIVPQFLLNIFVNGGRTIYSNSVGAEVDLRHDHFSLIPAITYTEYGTGDVVFSQKGQDPTNAGNWSVVDSSLKAFYFSADLLWSSRLANHWDIEYGADFGLGVLFGTLGNNWVYPVTGTQVSPTNYKACQTISDAPSCNPMDHQNASVAKVGGYQEPSWVNGGSKPNIFPLVNFPHIGIRYKPIKQLETRVGVGFSLTGFWFGMSANYGFEQPTK